MDLLKKEPIDNPKALEYIEVLDRKSQRLKKLTEDLVEASKASTGQPYRSPGTSGPDPAGPAGPGRIEDRLEAKGLAVVTAFPEEEVWVEADGRHLWRVIDNLLSNCAKYALEGTRIYLEVRRAGASAVLSIKNISRDPLNVPPETLMERFVRGDESRTTEGSGLGLSIAQSLTELQRGRFALEIDGDLFNAGHHPAPGGPASGRRKGFERSNLRSRGDVSAPRYVKKRRQNGNPPAQKMRGRVFCRLFSRNGQLSKRLDGWGQAGYTDFDERRRNREGRAAYRPVLAADPGGSLCPGQHARGSRRWYSA